MRREGHVWYVATRVTRSATVIEFKIGTERTKDKLRKKIIPPEIEEEIKSLEDAFDAYRDTLEEVEEVTREIDRANRNE